MENEGGSRIVVGGVADAGVVWSDDVVDGEEVGCGPRPPCDLTDPLFAPVCPRWPSVAALARSLSLPSSAFHIDFSCSANISLSPCTAARTAHQ